jgi:polyisoprenoid-binding protein YceI
MRQLGPTKLSAAAAAFACLATCAAPAWAQPAIYTIDPTHTFVNFEISHLGTSTSRGRFDRTDGTVQFDRTARTGRVEITIDATSVSTGTAALDRQLLGKNFFDAPQFPSAKFVADQFSFDGDKVTEVAGTLTMRGQTHPVRLKATLFNCYLNPLVRRQVCGGDFEATVQRSLWGMTWGLDLGIPDAVRLLVQVEALRQ